ncbi:hypothetical protein [Brotaphodocola sp.]|uniref:hypothetical protein n=1 Tax=Brotaphodocola sp. TaxID=3073577 RepID=UPI003D7E8296
MFSIEIREIEQAIQNLEQLTKKEDIQRQCLEKTISEIRQISEFEEVICTLQRVLRRLEEEECALRKMKIGLEKSCQLYQLCERRILQYKDEIMKMSVSNNSKGNSDGHNRN